MKAGATIPGGVSVNTENCAIPVLTIDGVFDDAWECVKPAVGKYTYAYFTFIEDESSPSDGFLYILNDWMFNTLVEIDADCFNLFTVFTGNFAQEWTIRVFGDQTTEVILNGETVQERALVGSGEISAVGAAGFGPSPNSELNHTIFELKFPALKGTFKGAIRGVYAWSGVRSSLYIQ